MSGPLALVTGATGFVGSHLVGELLARGWRVRVTVRRTSSLRWLEGHGVERVEADLVREPPGPEALADVTHIFHVAGLLAGTARELYQVNALGAARMAEAAASRPRRLRRFVLVSSVAAVGPSEPGRPLAEEAPCRPVSDYGRSKLEGERAVAAWADRMVLTVVRPPVVYGPRDRGLLPIFQSAAAGLLADTGTPRELSLVHVADLVRGLVEAALSERSAGGTYFVCHPEVASFQRLLGWLRAAANGRRCVMVRVPRWMLWSAAGAAEWLHRRGMAAVPLNRDKVREMVQSAWTCSPARARREFGYEARISARTGLAETADWYRREGWLGGWWGRPGRGGAGT